MTGPQLVDPAEGHERCFMARYAVLHASARRLAGSDRALADDLVHDAYVQFVLTRPDLEQIENLDAYLAVMLRNLHLARLRRKAHQRHLHVPIEEFDSAELALAHGSPHDRLVTREALRRVCAYACARKDVWKAASALILRFFHGFYPSEIDRIMRAPARTANRLLSEARGEARVALDRPAPSETSWARAVVVPALTSDDPAEILAALRHAIFLSCVPPCPSRAAIRAWYSRASPALDVSALSHVTSCPSCLDAVCATLGLPLLEDRSPLDPSDRGPGGDAGPLNTPRLRRALGRGVRAVEEHTPKQLQISVNGLPVGVLAVTAPENRVRFTVRLDEPFAFAELHSEQEVRMLWLNLAPATERGLIQRARVALAHDRWLELAVDFSDLHPTVSVEYLDPSLTAQVTPSRLPGDACDPAGALARDKERPLDTATQAPWWQRWLAWRAAVLVPAGVLLVLGAATSVWLARRAPEPPDSDTLLSKAISREDSTVLPADVAIHRTLELQIDRPHTGAAPTRHRIERWARGRSALRAVRVFDASGRLVAGQWTDPEQRTTTRGLGGLDEVWQRDLSAVTFRERYMSIGPCRTASDATVYTVTCEPGGLARLFDLVSPVVHARATTMAPSRAVLTLGRADLHARGLELTLTIDGDDQVVRLTELALRQLSISEVPSTAFVPDPARPATSVPATTTQPRAIATPSLEIQVWETIDRLPGREYLSVSRIGAGRLAVTGLVGHAGQRRALISALSALGAGSAVTATVQTFAEAAAREGAKAQAATSAPTRAEVREPAMGPAPIEHYLRLRLPANADVTAFTRALAADVLADAARAREHAAALVVLLDRFPDATREVFDQKGRAAWSASIARRGGACAAALDRLASALSAYLPSGADWTSQSGDVPSTIRRLAHDVAAIDAAIARAFTASAAGADVGEAAMLEVSRRLQQAQADARLIQASVRP